MAWQGGLSCNGGEGETADTAGAEEGWYFVRWVIKVNAPPLLSQLNKVMFFFESDWMIGSLSLLS